MSKPAETKKTATRLYVVIRPDESKAIVRAVSETQAKSHAASLDKYTARVAKPEDTLGIGAADVADATAKMS